MKFSKQSLQVVKMTHHDKIPALNNVLFRKDGTTVGSNGKCVLVVSPMNKKFHKSIPLPDVELTEDLCIPDEDVKEIIKNIPTDKVFKGLLESVSLKDNTGEKASFTIKGQRSLRRLDVPKYDRPYIRYRETLQRANSHKQSIKVALNRKRLKSLLEAVDAVCPDNSDNAVAFLEFTDRNDLILKALNKKNGQRVIAIMQSYKGASSNWLEEDDWEFELMNGFKRSQKVQTPIKKELPPLHIPKRPIKKLPRKKV